MEECKKLYDVIIIGGGPGGLTAAIYASRADLDVLVLEKMAPGGQLLNTESVDNVPGFPEGITGVELSQNLEKQAKRFGTNFKMDEVQQLDLSGDEKLVTARNDTYRAKTVIISTGESPKELGVSGEQSLKGKGVSYCATCDGAFFKNKRVAVVGGGDSAVEEALFLTRLASEVTLIHRREQLRAGNYWKKRAEENENLALKYNTVIQEIRGDNKLESLLLEDVNSHEQYEMICDGIFIYIGALPNTNFLENELTLDNGYLITDEDMKTEIPGVYAVGDVRTKRLRQVVTAMSDGAIAAFDIEKLLL